MSRTSTSIELQGISDIPKTITQPHSVYKAGNETVPLTETSDAAPQNVVSSELLEQPDSKTTAIVMLTVVCVTMISSMLSGVVAVALPSIAKDLELGPDVLLWYDRLTGAQVCRVDPVQAYLNLRPYLRLHAAPAGFHCRCCRLKTHVLDWVFPPVWFHARLRSGAD